MEVKIHVTPPEHRRQFPSECYYATVDGQNVGVNTTMFFRTKTEARKVAERVARKMSKNASNS